MMLAHSHLTSRVFDDPAGTSLFAPRRKTDRPEPAVDLEALHDDDTGPKDLLWVGRLVCLASALTSLGTVALVLS